MPTSQNGYSANDRSLIGSFTVPGANRKLALRKGDTSVILLDVAAWIHAHVEPIDTGEFDDWGYAERTIRGSSTTLSNHASGTAFDFNATQHPLAVRGSWSARERDLIHGRLALYDGCVRWGDDYSGRVDGMHFEINKGAAACKTVADRIRAGRLGGTPSSAPSKPSVAPTAPAIPEDIEVLDNTPLAAGRNDFRLIVPTGTASQLIARSWVSIVGNGANVTGTIYAQSDTGGLKNFPVSASFANGHSQRWWTELPSGTTQIGIVLDAPRGGTLALEAKAK